MACDDTTLNAVASRRWGLAAADICTRVSCNSMSTKRATATRKRFLAQRCEENSSSAVPQSGSGTHTVHTSAELAPWERSAVELYRYIRTSSRQQSKHASLDAKAKPDIVRPFAGLPDVAVDKTCADLRDGEKRLLLMLYTIRLPSCNVISSNIQCCSPCSAPALGHLCAQSRSACETTEQTTTDTSCIALLHLFAQNKLRSFDDVAQSATLVCDWVRGWVVMPAKSATWRLPRTFLSDVALCLARTRRLRATDVPVWIVKVFEGLWSCYADMGVVRRNATRWEVCKYAVEAVYVLQRLGAVDYTWRGLSVLVFLHVLSTAAKSCAAADIQKGASAASTSCAATAQQDAWCETLLCLSFLLKQHPDFAIADLKQSAMNTDLEKSGSTTDTNATAAFTIKWQTTVAHTVQQISVVRTKTALVKTILLNELLMH